MSRRLTRRMNSPYLVLPGLPVSSLYKCPWMGHIAQVQSLGREPPGSEEPVGFTGADGRQVGAREDDGISGAGTWKGALTGEKTRRSVDAAVGWGEGVWNGVRITSADCELPSSSSRRTGDFAASSSSSSAPYSCAGPSTGGPAMMEYSLWMRPEQRRFAS